MTTFFGGKKQSELSREPNSSFPVVEAAKKWTLNLKTSH